MYEDKPIKRERKAAVTCDIEITENSSPALRVGYVSVSSKLQSPRYLMGAGYLEQRCEWLGVIADALKKGDPIPTDDFLEVVAMLKRVADGESPATAFGLARSSGRQQDSERLEKMHEIADIVFRYSKAGHPIGEVRSKKPDAPVGAFRMAAAYFDVSDRQVKEAWSMFGESLSRFYAGGLWEEPWPSKERLTRRKARTLPRK